MKAENAQLRKDSRAKRSTLNPEKLSGQAVQRRNCRGRCQRPDLGKMGSQLRKHSRARRLPLQDTEMLTDSNAGVGTEVVLS